MLTLKAFRALKNKIDTKKAISGLFTAVTLFTVLSGNSSFITAGIGQTLEKTKLAMIEMLPIGEEITSVGQLHLRFWKQRNVLLRRSTSQPYKNFN